MADKVVSLKVLVDTSTGQVNVEALNDDLKETVANTEKVGKQSKEVSDKMSGGFAKVGDTIGQVNPALGGMISGLNNTTKAALAFIATPLGIALTAIVAAGAAFYATFKTFVPLMDKIEQGFAAVSAVVNTVKNTFVQVVTGAKSLGSAISRLGDDMALAAKRARELKMAQQDLDDELELGDIVSANRRAEINKLNVQAKDRTKTEKERLQLLKEAAAIEQMDFEDRKKLAEKELAIAEKAIITKAGLNKDEIKLLRQKGIAYKEDLEAKGGNYDAEITKLKEAKLKIIAIEDEATTNLEKIYNKRDAIAEANRAKREKAEADRLANIEKQSALVQATIKEIEAAEKEMEDYAKWRRNLEEQIFFGEVEETGEFKAVEMAKKEAEYLEAIKKENTDKLVALEKEKQDKMAYLQEQAGAALNLLATINEAYANKSEANAKKSFENGKKLAMAQTLVDTYFAAQKAYLSQFATVDPTSPIRANIAAALALAQGLARVAAIRNTKFGSNTQQAQAAGGGGVSGFSPQDTNYTPITPQSIRKPRNADKIKVYVTETDIREATGRVDDIASKAMVE